MNQAPRSTPVSSTNTKLARNGLKSSPRASISHVPQLSRVDPGDLARSLLHFVIHVLGPAGAIAAAAVPQADEPRFLYAPRQHRVEQPQIAALERIDPGGQWAK